MIKTLIRKARGRKKGGGRFRYYHLRKTMGKKSRCIFCEIVGLKAPAYRIHEDEFSLGILDMNPFTPGHCLVISKRHTRWWHDLTDEETRGLFSAARLIGRMIMKGLHPKLVCMYTRGTRVPHTHVHLVPTYTGDLFDNFFNALEKIPDYQREMVRLDEEKLLKEIAERIKEGSKHQKK